MFSGKSSPLDSAKDPQGSGERVSGSTLVVTGKVEASEDLKIEGRVDGSIELPEHVLTIGQHARINAEILARVVTVCGHVKGKILATEKVELREPHGSVEGDIKAPCVTIADGAFFRGYLDMSPVEASRAPATDAKHVSEAKSKTEARPQGSSPNDAARSSSKGASAGRSGRSGPSTDVAVVGAS